MEQKIRKVNEKYEIVVGIDQVIECVDLADAEKKIKSFRASETDSYLVKKEFDENNKLVSEIMLGY